MKQVKHEGVKGIMLIECHTRNSMRGPISINSHSRTYITYKYANYDVTMSIFKARISFELFSTIHCALVEVGLLVGIFFNFLLLKCGFKIVNYWLSK